MCASTRSGRSKCGNKVIFPGFCFFLIEDEVNDFAQVWVSLLVILL